MRTTRGFCRWTCDGRPPDPNNNVPSPYWVGHYVLRLRWRLEHRRSGYGSDSSLHHQLHLLLHLLVAVVVVVGREVVFLDHLAVPSAAVVVVVGLLPIRLRTAEAGRKLAFVDHKAKKQTKTKTQSINKQLQFTPHILFWQRASWYSVSILEHSLERIIMILNRKSGRPRTCVEGSRLVTEYLIHVIQWRCGRCHIIFLNTTGMS